MQPVAFLKHRHLELPELLPGEVRYVLAHNGLFRERREEMYSTCARIEPHDLRLSAHAPACTLQCGKLPRVLHRAMLGFFKFAHQVHGGEVALVLLYHPQQRRFRWYCPEQLVEVYSIAGRWMAADRIQFENPLELPPGYLQFGDAHLHPGPPEPSAMDVADDQDGLHLIVGHIDTRPQYRVTFVMDGTRFSLPPEAIFQDPGCQPFARPPQAWLKRIQLRQISLRW